MSAVEQTEDAQGGKEKQDEHVEILASSGMDDASAKVIADEFLQTAAVVAAEKENELTSLEREIAEMHHVEPTSPALAQRVADASSHNGGSVSGSTTVAGDADTVLLEISPPSRGVTPAVQADNSVPGNGELSGNACHVAGEAESDALKHEDLIAVLKGIDHGAEPPAAENKAANKGKDGQTQRAPSVTDSDLAEGVTIEGEGQFQIMEVVDDELDEGAGEKEESATSVAGAIASNAGSAAGLKSYAEATSKLSNDEIRAMALEQIAGLDARSADRQRRRKQDIKPLQVEENTDLASSLGADWSDDDKCGDELTLAIAEVSTTKAVSVVVAADQLSKDFVEAVTDSKVSAVVSKAAETERNSQPKVTSVVVVQSGKTGNAEPSSDSTDKDPEIATQTPQVVGFRRTRVIKRKIIWDPDAPETQFSYAKLVRNPTNNADTAATKTSTNVQANTTTASLTAATTTKSTVATGAKKEPPSKKLRPTTPKSTAASLKEKKATVSPNPTATHVQQAPATEKKVAARVATPMKTVVSSVNKNVAVANSSSSPINTAQSTKSAAGDNAIAARGPSPAKRRAQTPVANGAGGKKKKFSELDRLMGDEGAANMLNSLESERGRVGDDNKPHRPLMRSRAVTITERVMKRDPTPTTAKAAPTSAKAAAAATTNVATVSVSSPAIKGKRTAKSKPSSTWDYVYKQQANEDAMIIRRRSNSSYSSNASQHRLSLDAPATPKAAASNKSNNSSARSTPATTPASSTGNNSASKAKGTPKTPSSVHNTSAEVASPEIGSGGKATKGPFEFAKPNQKTKRRTKSPANATNALASDMKKQAAGPGAKRSARSPATVEDKDKEKEKASGTGKDSTPTAKEELPTSPPHPSDVMVKKVAKVAQIIFNTRRAKLDYTFTVQMMNKLVDVLDKLSKDADCNAVVMTTNAPHFCHGIDFTDLTVGSAEKRKQAAVQLATAVKNYLKTLATFPKPLIAGVNGNNSGLGVTQLPLFDIVIASDKSSYETPYAKIGQVPEGYCIWNNIIKIRGTFKTKLFWLCEKLHSTESALSGLVNKLTAPSKVNEDAMLTAKKIAAMSPQSYRFMKKATIHNHLDTIVTGLDEEFDAIIEQWTSSECLESFKKYLEAGHF